MNTRRLLGYLAYLVAVGMMATPWVEAEESDRQPTRCRFVQKDSQGRAAATAADSAAPEQVRARKLSALEEISCCHCDCYPEAKQTMRAALSDADREVRLAAMRVIESAAPCSCPACGQRSCDDSPFVERLAWSAYLHSKTGNWFEPDADVRAAAQRALAAMNQAQGAGAEEEFAAAGRQVGYAAEKQVLPEEELASLRSALGVATTEDMDLLADEPKPAVREPIRLRLGQATEESRPLQPTHVRPSVEQVRATAVSAFGAVGVAETESSNILPTAAETPVADAPRSDAARKKASEPHMRPGHSHRHRQPAARGHSPRATGIAQTAMSTSSSDELVNPRLGRDSARIKGTVRQANGPHKSVTLSFPPGTQPQVGSTLRVYHRYMMRREYVGDLKVVQVEADGVTARRVGPWEKGTLARGDDVVQ
jgi:hypothetical protein